MAPGPGPAADATHARRARVVPLPVVQLAYDTLYVLTLLVGLPFFLFFLATSRRWRAGRGANAGPARLGARLHRARYVWP